MANRSERGRSDAGLDLARGRTDVVPDLRRHLATAPPPYLQGALDNPETGEEEIMLLLQNRRAASTVLLRVGRDRRWLRSYQVKKGVVRHPKTPSTLARSLLPHLYWKDLAEIADDPRIAPAVKKQAEVVLAYRVDELTQGERIALARRAGRGVIAALVGSDEPGVLKALLGNSRLMEHDAQRIATRESAPREVLAVLARHPAWGVRHSIRISLVSNSRTPVPVALRLIEGLPPEELERLVRDKRVPKIVRVGADRRLEGRSQSSGSDGRG